MFARELEEIISGINKRNYGKTFIENRIESVFSNEQHKLQVGDEVVLVGRQNNSTINISSFSQVTQLLNNEMLSRLPSAIPRKVVK